MTASYLAITLSQALLATMQIYIAFQGLGIALPTFFTNFLNKFTKSTSKVLIFKIKKRNNHPFQAVEGVAGVNSKMNY